MIIFSLSVLVDLINLFFGKIVRYIRHTMTDSSILHHKMKYKSAEVCQMQNIVILWRKMLSDVKMSRLSTWPLA